MKVKWYGETLNIENQSDNPNKNFFCCWNNYTIEITLDEWVKKYYKKKEYAVICSTPSGGYIVDDVCNSIKEGLQECFNNIEKPLEKI